VPPSSLARSFFAQAGDNRSGAANSEEELT
jgi:hypothetical protein